MQYKMKQWFAVLLALMMTFTTLPATAMAESVTPTEGTKVEQVQALIDALPDADAITAENRAEVEAQLNAIDEAKQELPDEELEALDVTRYLAAAEALLALDDMAGANVPKTIASSIPYIDDKGTQQTQSSATEVESSSNTWSTGWYVVSGDVTISDRVTVSGDVNLILEDGFTLTASQGITVNSGNSLTIYGQSGQSGTLSATGSSNYAGIGGVAYANSGTITINGGTVKATGGMDGAGIGGGTLSGGGTITINGGTVTAEGGHGEGYLTGGAGIGGGRESSTGGTITITGGTVTATGCEDSAGIGGGGSDESIPAEGGNITISGGSVTANGGGNAPGIGGGRCSSSGELGASGSFSTGGNGHAVIYTSSISDTSKQGSWSGIFVNSTTQEMSVYGNQTLTQELSDKYSPVTLSIEENATLIINDDVNVTLTGESTIAKTGKLIDNGNITNEGIVANHGTIDGQNRGTIDNKGNIKNYTVEDKSIIKDVKITGNPICTYCKLTADALDFSADEGYTPPEIPISISNEGKELATIEKVEADFSFYVNFEIIEDINKTVAAGQTDTSLIIKPVADLPVGSYSGTIKITYNGMEETSTTVTVTFTVSQKEIPAPTDDPPDTPTDNPPDTPTSNNPNDTPKTGDESYLALWFSLIILSLLGITVAALNPIIGRKKLVSTNGRHMRK